MAITAPLAAGFAAILRRAFQVWGVFDPVGDALGSWLRDHVSPAQAEWTVAALVALLLYAAVVYYLIQRFTQIPLLELSSPAINFGPRSKKTPGDYRPPRFNLLEVLLASSWMLDFNPRNPKGKKELSFLAGGRIGEGANSNEHRWELLDDTLRIFRENGDLQNDFKFDKQNSRLICTNNSLAQGNKDQSIYKIGNNPVSLIPLNKAAEQTYANLHGTALAEEIERASAFGRARPSTEEILRLVMLNISKYGEVSGLTWPDRTRVPIPDINKFLIYPSENCLRYNDGDKPVFTELMTNQDAIDEFVRYGKSVSRSL